MNSILIFSVLSSIATLHFRHFIFAGLFAFRETALSRHWLFGTTEFLGLCGGTPFFAINVEYEIHVLWREFIPVGTSTVQYNLMIRVNKKRCFFITWIFSPGKLKILILNHYSQNLIKKHIGVRIQQIENRKSSNVDLDTQNEVFYDFKEDHANPRKPLKNLIIYHFKNLIRILREKCLLYWQQI